MVLNPETCPRDFDRRWLEQRDENEEKVKALVRVQEEPGVVATLVQLQQYQNSNARMPSSVHELAFYHDVCSNNTFNVNLRVI